MNPLHRTLRMEIETIMTIVDGSTTARRTASRWLTAISELTIPFGLGGVVALSNAHRLDGHGQGLVEVANWNVGQLQVCAETVFGLGSGQL